MRSKSCWTCKGISRHNLNSFLVDGFYNFDDNRLFGLFLEQGTPANADVRGFYPCVGWREGSLGMMLELCCEEKGGQPRPWSP